MVMAAKGYPGSYAKGSAIEGLDAAAAVEGVEIFHAGTASRGRAHRRQRRARAQRVRRSAARVSEAQARAYAAVDQIQWPEGFCRRDIGWQAVQREALA